MILRPATPPAQPSSAVSFGAVASLLDLAATLVRARGELGDTGIRDKRPRIRRAIDRAAHLTGDVEAARQSSRCLASMSPTGSATRLFVCSTEPTTATTPATCTSSTCSASPCSPGWFCRTDPEQVPQLYVHIENDTGEHHEIAVEVNNTGAHTYR
ncbi:MAG: hypothetical protein ACRDT6_19815 [Micromonosporaceae bacterium]